MATVPTKKAKRPKPIKKAGLLSPEQCKRFLKTAESIL
jgi:hypothetical protein